MKAILNKKEKAKEALINNLDFIQGTLVKLYRRCGKENCKCKTGGKLHGPAYYISTKENNKTQMTYIPSDCVGSVKKALKKNKKIKNILKEISKINIQQIKKEKKEEYDRRERQTK